MSIPLESTSSDDIGPLTVYHRYSPNTDDDKKGATAFSGTFCSDAGGVPILVVSYIDSRTLYVTYHHHRTTVIYPLLQSRL